METDLTTLVGAAGAIVAIVQTAKQYISKLSGLYALLVVVVLCAAFVAAKYLAPPTLLDALGDFLRVFGIAAGSATLASKAQTNVLAFKTEPAPAPKGDETREAA